MGFVHDFLAQGYTIPNATDFIKSYDPSQIPTYATLARNFVVLRNWHSAVPGPTGPNRLFLHCGTSGGYAGGIYERKSFEPYCPDMDTIYNVLEAHKKSWHIYYHDDLATVYALTKLDQYHATHFTSEVQSNFESFYADLKKGILSEYTFLVPKLGDDKNGKANSQHPGKGSGTLESGDDLMKEVYLNLFNTKSKFVNNTLFLITYDEHGGFWDSMLPPVIPVDHRDPYNPMEWTKHHANPVFHFDRLGVRVPSVLISPWLKAKVDDTLYEHCSVPKTITDFFHMGTNYLTNRVKYANNFIDNNPLLPTPRTDMETILK